MSAGFKPPEAVWLAPDPYSRGTIKPWMVLLALLLVGLGYWLAVRPTDGEEPTPSDGTTISRVNESDNGIGVGTCTNHLYIDGQSLVEGTGVAVDCGATDARYIRIPPKPDTEGCNEVAEPSMTIGLGEDDEICLQRIFRAGDCFPLSTPRLEAEAPAMLAIAVPCDAPLDSTVLPGVAQLLSESPAEAGCQAGAWYIANASNSVLYCFGNLEGP